MTEQVEEKMETIESSMEEVLLEELIIEDFEPGEKVMRVVPLRGMMIYPNTESHLDLGRKFSVNAVQECMRANEPLLLAFQKNSDAGLPEADNLYEIGVVAKVRRTINLPTEGMRVLVTGLYPVRVLEYHIDENEITATFEELPEPEGPMTTTTSPLWISALMFCRALTSPPANSFCRFSTRINTLPLTGSQPPLQNVHQAGEEHNQCQIDQRHCQQRHEGLICGTADNISALGQVTHCHVSGYRSLLQQHDKLVCQRRQYIFKLYKLNQSNMSKRDNQDW